MPKITKSNSIAEMENIKEEVLLKTDLFKKLAPYLLVGIIIILALTSFFFYKKSKLNSDTVSQAEIKSLVQKVGRLAVVPEDETPTIATVSDPEALKSQTFFVDAKKGDKVLIYSNAKKAVLYDPVKDKIVNIAPLNMDSTNSTKTSTNNTYSPTNSQSKTNDKKN